MRTSWDSLRAIYALAILERPCISLSSGPMTKGRDLEVSSFDDLTGAGIMRAAGFEAVFVAATMSPPGIEPPLELR